MYCSYCGKEISEDAKYCSSCGKPINLHKQQEENDKEIVIKEGLCNRVKSKLFVENGHGLLTNRRFIYSKHKFTNILAM